MHFKRLFSTLAVIAVGCTLWAADSGTRLRCRVLDSSKAPISGAKLTLQGGTLTAIGFSNKKGEYLFVDVPPGPYYLTIEKEGFASADVDSIELKLKKLRILDVTLSPQEQTEIDQASTVPQQMFRHGLLAHNR